MAVSRMKLMVLFFLCPVLFLAPGPGDAAEKSGCISCHTNLKGLIRLCWEVEKIKPRPSASQENSGEG